MIGGRGFDPWIGIAGGALAGWLTYWIGTAILYSMSFVREPVETGVWFFLLPFTSFTAWEIVLVVSSAMLGWALSAHRWRPFALIGYVGMWSLAIGYVVYALTVSIPRVSAGHRWLSWILFGAELSGLGMVLIFAFYSLDAPARRRWRRRSGDRLWDAMLRPHVAIVIPVYNEPVPMVLDTIRLAVGQSYPSDRYRVYVADDSTDPNARKALASACKAAGAVHVSRPNRRGFKAGALNNVIRQLPADVELVAVVDADFWVSPDFLASTVGYFADPTLSFVQTPQDYRNTDESFLTRHYHLAESFFYDVVMPSRNEENAIIFCGTMGVLRRRAIEDVGGFAEDQICEDADISPRLAAKGWTSLYVDRSFGKGLMPATFDAFQKQFHRWSFGNVRIMFARAPLILRSKMRLRQKFDFLASNLHWFDGLPILVIALVLLLLGIAPLIGLDLATQHQREMPLVALVPAFLFLDGLLRLRTVIGGRRRIGVGRALLVQGLWFSIKLTNLRAAVKATLGLSERFVRTPKDAGAQRSRTRALLWSLRSAPVETLLGCALVVVGFLNIPFLAPELTPGNVLMPVWLELYGMFFLCAPIYSYLSLRTLAQTAQPVPAPPRAVARADVGGRTSGSQLQVAKNTLSRGTLRGAVRE